jgi:hypothetical protein
VQLRWVGPQPTRRVKNFASVPLSFADGFPFLPEAKFLTRRVGCGPTQRSCTSRGKN